MVEVATALCFGLIELLYACIILYRSTSLFISLLAFDSPSFFEGTMHQNELSSQASEEDEEEEEESLLC